MTCIDIGANVGDSIALIRSQAPIPILGVEADNYYFSLLKENTKNLFDIELEHALVVGNDSSIPGRLVRDGGTGRVLPALKGSAVDSEQGAPRNLESILAAHPRFSPPRLIKLDTDGYDCTILMNAEDVLAESHPVIFFEYDPGLFNEIDDRGKEIFSFLKKIEYDTAVFYDNTGPYAFSVNLNDQRILEDAYAMSLSPAGASYFDVAVFHASDSHLAETLRQRELSRIL